PCPPGTGSARGTAAPAPAPRTPRGRAVSRTAADPRSSGRRGAASRRRGDASVRPRARRAWCGAGRGSKGPTWRSKHTAAGRAVRRLCPGEARRPAFAHRGEPLLRVGGGERPERGLVVDGEDSGVDHPAERVVSEDLSD